VGSAGCSLQVIRYRAGSKLYFAVKSISDIFTGVGEGLGEDTRLDADDVRLILQGQVAEPVEAIEQD